MTFDFARLFARIAADHPGRPALLHGDRAVTWAQLNDQAAALAGHLHASGLRRGDVAALAMLNRPEHLVALVACLRLGLTPANVNYRYTAAELADLLTLLRPRAIFFDASNLSAISGARNLMDSHHARLWIVDGGPPPPWGTALSDLLQSSTPLYDILSSPEDLFLKCTGGTTGRPTAVRWRTQDVARNICRSSPWLTRTGTDVPVGEPILVADARLVVASPLMHGSGQTRALGALSAGGLVITVPRAAPSMIWQETARHEADTLAIVGDAMSRPLADALTRQPHRWDLTALRTVTSSGAVWSAVEKQRLLERLPHLRLVETLGATEATGLGSSVADRGSVPATGTFDLGPHAAVVRSDGRLATPGEEGLLGVAEPHPLGTHVDSAFPASRFTTVDGTRYLLSGDHARRLDNDRVLLLGRSDECVNVGGEKVYLPEIVQVVLEHPSVRDAAVVPLPHPVRGQTLVALTELTSGTPEGVRRFLHQRLAPYKVPRLVVRVDAIPRTAAGKLSTTTAREYAERAVQAAPSPEDPPISGDARAHRSDAWQHLIHTAEQEQLLLEGALASLFAAPDIDRQVGKALGYPEWPQPLTLLPAVAPELVTATKQLACYLEFSARATADVVQGVARHGWPRVDRDGAAAADAVWLLMQHGDLAQGAREELLPEATRSAASRWIDGRHLALLDDRVQSLRGANQRYGTFVIVRDEQPRFLYPVDGTFAEVDGRRALIGMPLLSQDLTQAYSPITPYGAGRTTQGNSFTPPHRGRRPPLPSAARFPAPAEPVPADAVPVYLAATLRHRNEIRSLRDRLPAPLYSTARWLDLDPLTRPSCQFDAGIALNRLAARLCLEDVRRSRVLIAMGMSRRSAGLSVEMGCALAARIPVIYVGEPSCSFDMLPEVVLVPDVEAAVETALGWADG
ncbi:AMP-binding protein [Streptomyces antibioticus]|uniref:AMP-binding protein n=1 Tax=Streptomyces antibioticus TaxID=1890 RepID=UPI0033A34513